MGYSHYFETGNQIVLCVYLWQKSAKYIYQEVIDYIMVTRLMIIAWRIYQKYYLALDNCPKT